MTPLLQTHINDFTEVNIFFDKTKCSSTIQDENRSVKTLNPNNLVAVIATLTMNLQLTQKADLLFEIIGHWGIECLCSIVFCVV